MTIRFALLFLMGIALVMPASGADVYKCPQPDGKTTYSDRPCATGTRINAAPNSVAEVDQTEMRRKRHEVDKRLGAAVDADQAARDKRLTALRARQEECQGFKDAAARQRAWLSSISAAVAQAASNEIRIQRRKYDEKDCDSYL